MTDQPKSRVSTDLTGQAGHCHRRGKRSWARNCRNLARCGAKVACIDVNADPWPRLSAQSGLPAEQPRPMACDVTDSQRVTAVVDEVVKLWGGLQILVNNAGITRDNMILRMKDEQWDAVININLKGTFLFTRAAAKPMMKGRAGPDYQYRQRLRIDGQPGTSELLRIQGRGHRPDADHRLRIGRPKYHNQCRGARLYRHRYDQRPGRGNSAASSQANPLGTPWRAAGRGRRSAVLASDAASFITGHILTVDGGLTV